MELFVKIFQWKLNIKSNPGGYLKDWNLKEENYMKPPVSETCLYFF